VMLVMHQLAQMPSVLPIVHMFRRKAMQYAPQQQLFVETYGMV